MGQFGRDLRKGHLVVVRVAALIHGPVDVPSARGEEEHRGDPAAEQGAPFDFGGEGPGMANHSARRGHPARHWRRQISSRFVAPVSGGSLGGGLLPSTRSPKQPDRDENQPADHHDLEGHQEQGDRYPEEREEEHQQELAEQDGDETGGREAEGGFQDGRDSCEGRPLYGGLRSKVSTEQQRRRKAR